MIFVDSPETFQIIDCLDELMSTKDCFQRDLLSRSICVATCLPEICHEVRLRSVQTGAASLTSERVPKVGRSDNVLRAAPRTNEVKQQQDWRLLFVDRRECFRITDCLHRDLLSMSMTAATCMPVIRHEVRFRKVPAGSELHCSSLTQRVTDE